MATPSLGILCAALYVASLQQYIFRSRPRAQGAMEAPTQALILRPFFPDLEAEAAEGGIAARAAGTCSIAEFSAIFGDDLAALGVALSEIEQYHSDVKIGRVVQASARTSGVGTNGKPCI